MTPGSAVWSWPLDGRRLAGRKHLSDLSHAGIGIHEVGSQEIQWLTDFGEWPVWLRDSRRLLFSHQGELFLLDTTSGSHREVLSLPQPTLGSVGLSTDETNLYFTVQQDLASDDRGVGAERCVQSRWLSTATWPRSGSSRAGPKTA